MDLRNMYKECPNCGRNWYDCVGNCIFDDLPNKGFFPVPVLADQSSITELLGNKPEQSGEARESILPARGITDSRGGENTYE